MGPVISGRASRGFLVERCSKCHRYNAVFPTYGKAGVRMGKLDGDKPVLQYKMEKIGQ